MSTVAMNKLTNSPQGKDCQERLLNPTKWLDLTQEHKVYGKNMKKNLKRKNWQPKPVRLYNSQMKYIRQQLGSPYTDKSVKSPETCNHPASVDI